MSSRGQARPTVASKNSTKVWHNCFQMNDCMAAQHNVDAPPSLQGSLISGPLEEDRQEEDFPIGHQAIIIARWTWAVLL